MNNDAYIVLIYKNLKGEISSKESELLDQWLTNPENEEIERNLRNDWHLSGNYEPQIMMDHIDVDAEYDKLQKRIKVDSTSSNQAKTVELNSKSKPWMAYAAALAALVVSCFWLYNSFSDDVQFATIETNTGQTEKITLADGTSVHLNENSSITYPETFSKKNREVILSGEAFFDVAHNPDKPFSIETPNTKTTVLGTSFNLEDYNNGDNAFVAVYSGKVKFEDLEGNAPNAVLSKGNKATLDKKNQLINKEEINHSNDNSWMSQTLSYNNAPLNQVVKDLETHFGIEISIDSNITGCPYNNSKINLIDQTPQDILNIIGVSFSAEISKISEKSYHIQGGKCK